jgi:CelD/BcsL family acetyltransferase involved in cellulose biosynthesis
MESELEAWRDLARRAIEPNVFAEPELVVAGIQHLRDGRNVALLLVWEGARSTAGGGMLRGVFPLIMPRLTVTGQIRVWSPVSGSPGVPLVDRKAPVDIIEAALAFLAARYARFSGLALSHVPTDGAFAAALRSAATRTRRPLEPSETYRRYVLFNAQRPDVAEGMRRRIIDELRDGRQRLAVLGDVEMDHARTARWVRDAVEELLVLDASGPAGRRGEALLQTTGMASFLRIATRQLAHAARCRVDVLRVGGRAIAAAIIIESEHQAWLWQLATDATHADLDPETQLLLDVTRTQMDRPGLERTEACPGCESAAITDLWEERTAADYLVAIRPQSSPATLAARIGEGLRKRLRSAAREARPRPIRL